MWMVNVRILCRKHLMGEHGEIHKHKHVFVKGHSIEGRKGQIEPLSMKKRHDTLAEEMIRRGFNHKSPYENPDLSGYDLKGFIVNTKESLKELTSRCSECEKNHKKGEEK